MTVWVSRLSGRTCSWRQGLLSAFGTGSVQPCGLIWDKWGGRGGDRSKANGFRPAKTISYYIWPTTIHLEEISNSFDLVCQTISSLVARASLTCTGAQSGCFTTFWTHLFLLLTAKYRPLRFQYRPSLRPGGVDLRIACPVSFRERSTGFCLRYWVSR